MVNACHLMTATQTFTAIQLHRLANLLKLMEKIVFQVKNVLRIRFANLILRFHKQENA